MGDIWTSSSAGLRLERDELGGAGSARQVTVDDRNRYRREMLHMVQSKAASVDDYLAGVEPARAGAMARIRQVALDSLPGYDETMRYGMPTYAKGAADAGFAFNSQKQYISLYVSPRVHALHAEALKGLDAGKSCIRYRKPEQIDFELLASMLRDTAALGEANC
jgi:uncharacterized protein YdhG (YjbR/CyaY superfamily)